ncbi:hypothetical protein NLU13_8285 [Sarocladium strictum]|uniref:FCP1 homology domain-containing protein n=1 Tax=Sarocladium strictum TaxID=5046 RepID=A0AA39L4U6_SARSR|nr:hypothetical protein NLU13_8285 [Sarocladium strictum]
MAAKAPTGSSGVDAHLDVAPGVPDTVHETELLSPEGGTGTQKGRGHLQVPSRSSSQKNQSSPTSTGLSGATVSESRNSVSERSKDSKASTNGRQRNGSASSNRTGGDTEPTTTAANTQPNSPSANPPKKRKGGLFSLFGCCVSPDTSNSGDEETENVHKLDRLPQRPTTSKAPAQHDDQLNKSPNEKESQPQGLVSSREQHSQHTNPDQITVAEDEDHDAHPPAVTVDPPKSQPVADEPHVDSKAAIEDDAAMDDAQSEEPQTSIITQASEDEGSRTIPPPPPPAGHGTEAVTPATEEVQSAGEPQKALLGPIRPEHRGRKCLVLDLDETLVHSSFKILHQADFTIPVEIEGNYHNVYVIKRPGVDEFMKRVGELYEVVVFTASVSKYGDPLLDQLDIHKVVHHRLFRESCYNHQGNYVKDLSQVGRDLKDTIIIDNSPTSYIFHPQHAVPISSWFSDAHDNELLDLIPVLEDLAGPNVADVSLVLDVTL